MIQVLKYYQSRVKNNRELFIQTISELQSVLDEDKNLKNVEEMMADEGHALEKYYIRVDDILNHHPDV